MGEPTTANKRFTPRASLAAIGLKLQDLKLFDYFSQTVRVPQKKVKFSPAEKLYDAFVTILAGTRGLNESTTRCAATKLYSAPSAARLAPSIQSSRTPLTPAPQRTSPR
jgi:hypothetical protein